MHIAVSAEARNRANREFRAIATSNPFIPSPRLASPPLSSVSPPPSLFRSSRFQFRPDPAEYISPSLPALALLCPLRASPLPPLPRLHIRACFSPFFFLFPFSFFFLFFLSLHTTPDDNYATRPIVLTYIAI